MERKKKLTNTSVFSVCASFSFAIYHCCLVYPSALICDICEMGKRDNVEVRERNNKEDTIEKVKKHFY
jgi:hypothetical protein